LKLHAILLTNYDEFFGASDFRVGWGEKMGDP